MVRVFGPNKVLEIWIVLNIIKCNFVDSRKYKLKWAQERINLKSNNSLNTDLKFKMGCANVTSATNAQRVKLSKKDLGMQPFRAWLNRTSKSVKAGAFGPSSNCSSPLRIVMGNTSCDVDSAIGAMVLAYYYKVKLGQEWVPVINCRREDFYCNLEIVRHLENCKIPHSDLYFYDEFRA